MISWTRKSSLLIPIIRVSVWIWIAFLPLPIFAAFDVGAAFNTKCSACHSVGKGDVVGPDLHGVTQRRDNGWLHKFIRSSQSVIRSGDRTAVALFEKYRKRMPDHELSDSEISLLLAFIAAGGPKTDPGEYRLARTATAAEVAHGRDLFTGATVLANRGAACVQCHSAGDVGGWRSGTLAGDLTWAYLKYRDAGLTRALGEARFPLMASYRERPLTRAETFALKAFLYQTARAPQPAGQLAAAGPLFLDDGRSSPFAWLTQWFSGRGAANLQ